MGKKKGNRAVPITNFNPDTGEITLRGGRTCQPQPVIGRPVEVRARPQVVKGVKVEGWFGPRGGISDLRRKDKRGNLYGLKSDFPAIREAAQRAQHGSADRWWDKVKKISARKNENRKPRRERKDG